MTNYNYSAFNGRLIKDAEVTTLDNGTVMCRYCAAINRTYYVKKDNIKKTETTYINSAIFGPLAEAIGKYLVKGQMITASGHLKTTTWNKEGKQFSTLEFVTETIELIAYPKKDKNESSVSDNEEKKIDESVNIDEINDNAKIASAAVDVDYEYDLNQSAVYGDIF